MSWFAIGIYEPKYDCNVGTLFRSAHMFGAKFLFTIGGRRYKRQPGDTSDATSHVPYFHFETLETFKHQVPEVPIICAEITEDSHSLQNLEHPKQAIYLLGNESKGIPISFCKECPTVRIETPHSLNVSVAGSVVMYDRFLKVK